MPELLRHLEQFPADLEMHCADRGPNWEKFYREEIKSSVDEAITALELDKSWEDMNIEEQVMADTLFESILGTLGPCFDRNHKYGEGFNLFENLHGRGLAELFGPVERLDQFTANHGSTAIGVEIIALDSDGMPINDPYYKYGDVMNMPTYIRGTAGKPTLGDISPITITQERGEFQLSLETPKRHVWRKLLKRSRVEKFFHDNVGTEITPKYVEEISQPCPSLYNVMILRPTCQKKAAGCEMCSVARGDGVITNEHKEHVSKTLDKIFKFVTQFDNPLFTQTLSGGSTIDPDGGFKTAFGWGLELIRQKIQKAERESGKKIKVNLELEMMLPPDKKEWFPIIYKLNDYINLGWDINLAINMEALGSWRNRFIPGIKGQQTLEDHKEFNKALKFLSGGKIGMSTLIMFGMKPADMDWKDYMLEQKEQINELIKAGIHPDLIPVKVKPGQAIEAYPPPDPILYMIQYFALRKMIEKAHMRQTKGGGCVYTCGRCHHVDVTRRAMSVLKNKLPEKLEKILEKRVNPEYKGSFRNLWKADDWGELF